MAVLVPRPRINLILYYGGVGPRAAWRRQVVRHAAIIETEAPAATDAASGPAEARDDERPPRAGGRLWTDLMHRTLGIDVLARPRCGGRLCLLALIEQAEGHRTDPPSSRPAHCSRSFARNLKAAHTVEIPCVFNHLRASCVYPDTSSPELVSGSAAERALAERVSSYCVNFARTGDPNGTGLPRWPAFSDASAVPMIIGDSKEVPDPERFAISDKLYAKMLAGLKA